MRRPPFAAIAAAAVALCAAASLTACTGSSSPVASASSSSSSTLRPAPSQDTSRPNIVFVLTDDLSMNLISHMPHVQALQKAGTTMSNFDVVDSLCCPSRTAIFTGEYPHDDGVFTNGGADGGYGAYNRNGNEAKTYALSLQRRGYTTGFMGKYLNAYQPTDPIPPGWNEWDGAGKAYPEFDYKLNENGKIVKYGHDPQDYLVDVLSAKADAFIDRTSSTGKPFMLQVATFAPHQPYTPAPRYRNAAKDVSYPRTPAYNAIPTAAPSWLKNRPALSSTQRSKLLGFYRERIEADLAVDDLIANLQKTLDAKGIAKNTYLVFSSDNGYHMGEYRLLAGKQTAFDTDIHVPLIVSGPGVPAGHVNDQLASNIDLAPTFEALTGAQTGSTVDGVSLADLWHGGRPSTWQQGVLIEHHGPNDQPGDPDRQNAAAADPPSYEAVRTAGALYVRYVTGEQEYYDTTRDPYELHNLAAQGVPPALPAMLTALQNCHGAAACQAAAR